MITLSDGLYVDALGFSKAERLSEKPDQGKKDILLALLAEQSLSDAAVDKKLDYLNNPQPYETVISSTMYGSPENMAALAGLVQDRAMTLAANDPKKANAMMLSDLAYKRSQLLSSEKRNANRDATATQALKSSGIALGLITEEEFVSHFTIFPDNYKTAVWETPASHALAVKGEETPRIIVQIEDLI